MQKVKRKEPAPAVSKRPVNDAELRDRLSHAEKRIHELEEELRRTQGGTENRMAMLANLLLESIADPEGGAEFFNPAVGSGESNINRCWINDPDCERVPDQDNFATRMQTCTECDVFHRLAPDAFTRLGEIINGTIFLLRQKHQQYTDTQQQLIQSEKLAGLGELAAGLAHEINTPTGIILSRLDCMDGDDVLPETAREDLHVIRRHAERLRRITSSLTSFARRHKIEKKVVVVQELLRELFEILDRTMIKSQVDIKVELPEAPLLTFGDATMLQQVFMNIILNARDAMPAGGQLAIRAAMHDRHVEIEFEDTGIGMEEEVRKRVFDPFFTTKDTRGTGLGLSVSYGIIKDHKGNIEVESEPGQGSLFRVVLTGHHDMAEALA